jgi:hypothetical protein
MAGWQLGERSNVEDPRSRQLHGRDLRCRATAVRSIALGQDAWTCEADEHTDGQSQGGGSDGD